MRAKNPLAEKMPSNLSRKNITPLRMQFQPKSLQENGNLFTPFPQHNFAIC